MNEASFDWSQISSEDRQFQQHAILSEIDVPEGDPDVEHQISQAETPHSIDFFRKFHLPMIEAAGLRPEDCRVLEIGSGFGQLAYGTLQSISPSLYVGTDVFPQLVTTLENNLPRWTHTATAAALLDPQRRLFLKPNSFNVIQSHSVLHHVLDYRGAVKQLFDVLPSPGLLIFAEPCLESYLYFLTLYNVFELEAQIPESVRLQMSLLRDHIVQRSGHRRNDLEFLSQFGAGDKYIYSAYDLTDLAESVGARLLVKKDNRDPKGNYVFELSLRGADQDLQAQFRDYLSKVMPEGVENAYFSDLRQVFALVK